MAEDGALRIHIVEDDEDIANLISRFLARNGYDVSQSGTGEEGLENILEQAPDLLILDIRLPGISGLEVMDEVQKEPRLKDIPILFLTGVTDEATVVECLRGGDEYMQKPPRLLELEARVRKILDRTALSKSRPATSADLVDRLTVEHGKEVTIVPLQEILYVEASGKYSYVYTDERRFLTNYSIGELEKRPGFPKSFLRVHRSYLVNVERVRKLVREKPRKVVVEYNGKTAGVPVGDAYYSSVKTLLNI